MRNLRIRIYSSEELSGLIGENGERICVFVRDFDNPLNSEWAWAHTEKEAQKIGKELSQ